MLNKYPLWKYLLVGFVLIVGIYYSLPNLYPNDAAVQIRATQAGLVVNEKTLERAEEVLDEANIEYFGAEVSEQSLLVRLYNSEDQLKAKAALQTGLGSEYIIALNLGTDNARLAVGAGRQTNGAGPRSFRRRTLPNGSRYG